MFGLGCAAVISLFHHVLPSLRKSWLRTFLSNKDVHTLILLVPEDKLGNFSIDEASTDDELEESEDEESSDAGEDDEGAASDSDEQDDDAGGEVGRDEKGGGGDARRGGSEGESGSAAYWRPRLAGAMSFESGERLGQHLVQVSLLGVRLRYQKLGVGSRLCRTLLQGQATTKHPEAAIAWADSRAVSRPHPLAAHLMGI